MNINNIHLVYISSPGSRDRIVGCFDDYTKASNLADKIQSGTYKLRCSPTESVHVVTRDPLIVFSGRVI